MKTKFRKSITKPFLVALSAALLMSSLASCGTDTQIHENANIHKTNVKRASAQEYGAYVYTDSSPLSRYNINTNVLSKTCFDPACGGSCPLDDSLAYTGQIQDGKLFFYSLEAYTGNVYHGYQDLMTGEVTVLKTLERAETTSSFASFPYDGQLYYSRKILREGGSAENPNDYIQYDCRIPVSGGEEEPLYESEGEYLFMVADGQIISCMGNVICTRDVDTLEKKELFAASDYGYTSITDRCYLDGKLYLKCKNGESIYSEYRQQTYSFSYLISVDIFSGEVKQIIESPIEYYVVTDEGIYYSPMKLRHRYVPDDYMENPLEVDITLEDEDRYFCNLDGSGSKVVYTNAALNLSSYFTVIDNVLYGWVSEYDEVDHGSGERYFAAIDFESGKITPAEDTLTVTGE